jgi:ABC-type bacteriocin/lantibiotic exporter with double-glycine peptidase domain
MSAAKNPHRHLLAPEVVQTSAMDCGPASLKCMLEGFGISASYGRLREACQIDVDGSSIDTLEEISNQLGLEADQIMVPTDHVGLADARTFPAIIVVRLPNNFTHFVVAWRRLGPLVQVMDPSGGRRWMSRARFLNELYVHTIQVPADGWREWAGSDEFLRPLRRRLAGAGISGSTVSRLIDRAMADETWRTFGALDAATRMVASIVRSGGISKGKEASRVLEHFVARVCHENENSEEIIPADYWSVRISEPDSDGSDQLRLRGAVLLRVRGRRVRDSTGDEGQSADTSSSLSPELLAALEETPSRPGLEFLRLLRAGGLLTPAVLFAALIVTAFSVMVEILLLRVLFDLSQSLQLMPQRLGAITALLVFVAAIFLLEFLIASGMLRLGRHFEGRLRLAFFRKIPRLGDQYFRSRLISDMAERSHSIHTLRELPTLAARLIRAIFEIVLCTAGIIWLDPSIAAIALALGAVMIALPLISQRPISHLDLRVRTHLGALSRFYLDSFLGLVAVRTHGAERAVRREHESLLTEWFRAAFGVQKATIGFEGLQFLIGFALAAWLLHLHLMSGVETGRVLLFIYWALNIPALGQELSLVVRQYPVHRNVTLRLLEPLGAPEEPELPSTGNADNTQSSAVPRDPGGVSISMESVSVRAAGHSILEDINLSIGPGSHVAVLGLSGAGKSSLVGILLGWHRAATGQVLVDGEPLNSDLLKRLRSETVWVDPAVQLWNRTLLDNLRYGSSDSDVPFDQILDEADLRSVLEKMPQGLQTPLGEGGALLSAGEGQRVRFGRSMYRPKARLIILDEPFRGLDREQRRRLLVRARKFWSDATLLCITHDIGDTSEFERVLLIEEGRIAEDGDPKQLAGSQGSRYRTLIQAEEKVHETIWSSSSWRRLTIERGMLIEDPRGK